jgi:hypothetical protein
MDLLDVFGGQDNLRLMCEAEGFYENAERGFIRFKVGDKLVYLFSILDMEYVFIVYHLGTFVEIASERSENGAGVRALFERYTGYSLSF